MGLVCRIFVLQQINVEKNGLHSLKDWQISILYHIEWLSRFLFIVDIRSKTAEHLLIRFRHQNGCIGKWPLFESSYLLEVLALQSSFPLVCTVLNGLSNSAYFRNNSRLLPFFKHNVSEDFFTGVEHLCPKLEICLHFSHVEIENWQ